MDNAPGSPQAVNLTGTAVQPPTPPAIYTFLTQATSGGVSHSQTISVNVQ
jgi:hypothetical protein